MLTETEILDVQAPALAMIGALLRVPAPVLTYRRRLYRDYSGVVSHGAACRAVVDVELERRVSGEKLLAEADATQASVVYRAEA